MKFLKTLTVALISTTVSASLFKSTVVDSWDSNDLKDYLKDNSISFDEKKVTLDQLKELSRKQFELAHSLEEHPWYHPEGLKQKVLGLYKDDSVPHRKSNYVDYENVKNWIFGTWSTKDIEKLLKKSGIKYEPTTKRSQLTKIAQENYDQIAKYFKASGKYPGNWLYSNWDTKSLKKWLDNYGIDYRSIKDSRDDLVKKVRDNSYKASLYTQEEKDSLLDSLDLASQSLFDKAGSIQKNVFEAWSTLQLTKWLRSHEVKIDDQVKDNKEHLVKIAGDYVDELKSDVEYWTEKASKKVSPFFGKGTEKIDNVINDTFFVGIESWSRDRLKAFLKSREVTVPMFASKKELINLVKSNKYKPIKNFDSDFFFEGWSKENVQKWVQEQSDIATENSKSLWIKIKDLYSSFGQNASHYFNKASEVANDAYSTASDGVSQMTKSDAKDSFFDYWSDIELTKYLESFGIYNTKGTKHEQLITMAKKNTLWFVNGGSVSPGYIESGKLAIKNLYTRTWLYLNSWF